MIILGGLGSVPGSVAGAAVLTVLNDSLAGFQNYRPLIFGAILIASMLFMPGGIASAVRRLRTRWAGHPPMAPGSRRGLEGAAAWGPGAGRACSQSSQRWGRRRRPGWASPAA